MCTCVQAYMLTCLHAYMRTRLHACAYMFARLYALICLDTTVFLHAYVLTCLLATPCCPTLTHHLASRSRPRAGTDWTVGVWGGFRVRALGQTPSVQSVPALGLLRDASLNRVAGARLRQPVARPSPSATTTCDNHLTPCDTYLITISGRTSSTGVRHTFRFLVFAFWFSILPLVFDSVFFQIFPALPTVPWGPGVPSQAPKLQNFNFLTYTCEPSVTGQGFLGAIIPCTAGNRISRGEPPTSA